MGPRWGGRGDERRRCSSKPAVNIGIEIIRDGCLPEWTAGEGLNDELVWIYTDRIILSPNGPVVALNIPIGQGHTVRALESGTVIMEVKDGPYEPLGEEDILTL